jgi:CheY-like chemotaxis protein
LKNVPVIILSVIEEKVKGFDLGASAYLTKPIDQYQLMSTLRQFCPDKRLTCFVVGENIWLHDFAKKWLNPTDWYYCETNDGKKAWTQLQYQIPDIFLIDSAVLVMEHFELLDKLQQQTTWSAIPIVVVTTMAIGLPDQNRLTKQVKVLCYQENTTYEELLAQINGLMDFTIHIN